MGKKAKAWKKKLRELKTAERQVAEVLRPETERARLWKKFGSIDLSKAFKHGDDPEKP